MSTQIVRALKLNFKKAHIQHRASKVSNNAGIPLDGQFLKYG